MASEWLFPTNQEREDSTSSSRNEELFVFGYACKLFRDDEQAQMVDGGTYMIPWMGDEKLLIDRYDGRGHLFDLRPYDADSRKGLPTPVLTEDEKNIEKLCDEERYLELHTDLAEKAMYEEEEWKRYYESLSEGYQAVGFSYDGFGQQHSEPVQQEQKPNPEEMPFTPPPELQLPAGTQIPSTVKENAKIEKTAKFIAEHGVQMEIVMKTKQANNPSFQFMHFENELHPYYKHLVKMIKSKKYIPKSPDKEPKVERSESMEGDHDEGHGYLHPTLLTTNRASPVPETYKPVPMPKVSIHETPYGQLLQSFAKVNKEVSDKKVKEAKKELKAEPAEHSNLPACVAQPVYGSSMPPPPGVEPVQLPESVTIKQEPTGTEHRDVMPSTSPPPQIVPPPPDVQPIIDRMAMYVAKNGEEFAMVVKSKNDPRFQFLEPWHSHYAYYDFKRHLFQEEMDREKKEQEEVERQKEREKAELLAKGVKFKLKKAKEQDSSSSLEKKTLFQCDDSSDEDSDSTRERQSKSGNVSGASTPTNSLSESKSDEMLERKLAEQRMRDRIAASAREKLSLADKEMQIKLERKKKAAMFINLLKSKNPVAAEIDNTTDRQPDSGRSTPVRSEERSRHKSKGSSRDRSRSGSRDRRSKSRRSRSRSRERSKKKRKRSPTPPSAYTVTRRSPLRFPAPPPPPRYIDSRSRYSRSPSRSSKQRSRSRSRGRSSKHRSRSRSPSRSKSKKKKRSRSPKSRKEDSSHRKSSKKKKKKSHSRSKDEKTDSTTLPAVPEEQVLDHSKHADMRVTSAAMETGETTETVEDVETRASTPEPGQIVETGSEKEHIESSPRRPPDIDSDASYSTKTSPQKCRSRSKSRSSSNMSSPRSASRSRSPSPRNSRSRSRSHSRSSEMIVKDEYELSREGSDNASREVTPQPSLSTELNGTHMSGSSSPKNVSSYMLDRVRAIIKASKEAVKTEDMFAENG